MASTSVPESSPMAASIPTGAASAPLAVDMAAEAEEHPVESATSTAFAVAAGTAADGSTTHAQAAAVHVAPVIDLCDADDSNINSYGQHYAQTMAASLSKSQRKRKRSSPKRSCKKTSKAAASVSAPDAIEIDLDSKPAAVDPNASSPQALAAARYRQKLGPMRFDFSESFKAHAFEKIPQNAALKTNKLYKELLEYKLNLPIEVASSIFCRVCESRLDLIRSLITGPEGTPYANGCFLFDLQLADYAKTPPKAKFLTTGNGRVRFNPNLYNCGKVCLSLLGTWTGPGWQANKSTLLQVLVSIQGLILVPDPYFNEPGFAHGKGKKYHDEQSEIYNRNIRHYTLEYAIDGFLKPLASDDGHIKDYPEFGTVIKYHFCERAEAIEEQLDAWIKLDSSIKSLAERVRKNLRTVVSKFGQSRASKKAAPPSDEVIAIDEAEEADSRKPPANAKAPPTQPEVVTID